MPDTPTARQLFDEHIPIALRRHADAVRRVGAVFVLRVTGDGGGEWTLDLAATPPTCRRGAVAAADCSITLDHDAFTRLAGDLTAGVKLFFERRILVEGDPAALTRLQLLLTSTGGATS
jgi:hypothetical protein